MDILAIDIGTQNVGLCKWDGRSLLVQMLPAAAPGQGWAAWIEAMAPSEQYSVLFRWPSAEVAQTLPADTIATTARAHGASDLRVITDETSSDPAIAAARYAADRERLGRIIVVEAGTSWTTFGLVEPDGRIHALGRLSWPPGPSDVGFLGAFLRGFLRIKGGVSDEEQGNLPLVCGGGAGPPVAAALADACGLRSVLIPPYGGAIATVGMLLADIVIRFEEEMPQSTRSGAPDPSSKVKPASQTVEVTALRRAFGRLMDRASDAITREGYDLDDAVCERFALVGPTDGDEAVEVTCDDLADGRQLLSRFRAAVAQHESHGWHGLAQPGRGADNPPAQGTARNGLDQPGRETDVPARLEVRAVRLKATIHTRKPDFPIAPSPTHALDAAILRNPPADAIVPPGATVYSRDALPANIDLPGPAAICERFTTTVVPTGWTARRTAAGGLMLLRGQAVV